jgi:hypothetical protein
MVLYRRVISRCPHCLRWDEPARFECWPCAIERAQGTDELREMGRALLEEFSEAHRAAWEAGVALGVPES